MTNDQQFMFALLALGVYAFQLFIVYELIKSAIKNSLKELKADEKKTAEKSVIFNNKEAKIED